MFGPAFVQRPAGKRRHRALEKLAFLGDGLLFTRRCAKWRKPLSASAVRPRGDVQNVACDILYILKYMQNFRLFRKIPYFTKVSFIQGTMYCFYSFVADMGINFCGFAAFMAQKFLNNTKVSTAFQQMSCKTMPQRMDAGFLFNLCLF